MADWLVFKLAEGKWGRGDALDSSVVAEMGKDRGAAEAAAKKALGTSKSKAQVSSDEVGVRVADASPAEVVKIAEAVEKAVGGVGISRMSTNEWWDRDEFTSSGAAEVLS